jgi:hypothetical protein
MSASDERVAIVARRGLRGRVPVPERVWPRRGHGRAGHRVRAGDLHHCRLHGARHRDEESAQAFGLVWLFPLTFVSSAFVPISTMPGWLQAFAKNQPVTLVVDRMRALALGGSIAENLWTSIAWLAGIFIVFIPLAVRAYRRAA